MTQSADKDRDARKELIRCLRAYANSGDAPGSILQAMDDAADALEATPLPETGTPSPDQLIKIDDGQSTHARTAKEWLDLARADLASRSASGSLSVPEGMKCVPTKPTPRMLEIGYEKAAFPRDPEIAAAMWTAMVEAAPTLPYALSTTQPRKED